MSVAYVPEKDPQGNVTGWVASLSDMTDRKRTEDALLESELRTRLIIEKAYDAFVCVEENGTISDWNPQAEVVFWLVARRGDRTKIGGDDHSARIRWDP